MKPFLLITGMHRSGTSFLARALNLSGVYLGNLDSLTSHEWSPLEDNLRGHWENKIIQELAEKTLEHNNGSWGNIPEKIEVTRVLGKKIKTCITDLEKNRIFATGFKDPRILLVFDSWRKYLPKNLIIIGIFRHPLKVAESLKKRNGFSYEKSLDLWKAYNQKLLKILEKHDGFLLDFDWPKKRLLKEIMLISKNLGLLNVDLSEWYTEELFHSDKTYDSKYQLPKDIQELYRNLKTKLMANQNVKIRITFSQDEISKVNLRLMTEIQKQGDYFKKFAKQKDKKILDIQEELTERVSWAKKLDEEAKQKDKKILDIQEELTETTKQKDKKILDIQEELTERLSWAKKLDEEAKQKDKKILDIQEELTETTKQKDKKILDIQEELTEKKS